jgi:hypothetical protein
VRAILGREIDGLALNHAAVLDDDRQLHADALRVFGKWDLAVQAAGLDPARVRRHRRWNANAVVRRIRQTAAEGKPLNLRAIQLSEATLASAAYRYFRSWDEALRTAGFDPDEHRRRGANWSRERVIIEIKAIRFAGGKLNHAAVGRSSLSRAAVDLFGTWDDALRAAGLDPNEVRVYRKPWTRSDLIAEIRRKHTAGEPLNAKDVKPDWIRRPACRLFGSWDGALRAAGLEPRRIRRRPRHA